MMFGSQFACLIREGLDFWLLQPDVFSLLELVLRGLVRYPVQCGLGLLPGSLGFG